MIYLDNAATTKPSAFAINNSETYLKEKYFNPSALYRNGIDCLKDIKSSKNNLLSKLGVNSDLFEVVYTSCGSESDNLAIFCCKKRGLFVTDLGEHSAVYKSFLELKNRGVDVKFISLNKDGSVNLTELYKVLNENKVDFLSIMHVNNETGAVNDINEIAKTAKKINKDTVFHSDGVQAFGKIPYVLSEDIDFYSISAHKINALKGTGALIKKKQIKLSPLIYGGGQENGFRSGTENVFGIKVFENACNEHYAKMKENYEYVLSLKDFFIKNLDKDLFTVISSENSSPYILSVSAKDVKGEILMHNLEENDIIVGNGSACSSKNPHSRVIENCGYKNDVLNGVLRISFSNENTISEIQKTCDILNIETKKLREIMR